MIRRFLPALLLLAACGAPRFAGVRPERIPELEASGDHRALGQAYYAAGRYDDARRVLAPLVAADPTDLTSRVYLAFSLDELLDYDAAADAYRTLARSGDADVAGIASERLVLLERKRAVVAAREALAREAELQATPPRPNTIAVLPFRFAGSDDELAPLARGFSELLVTDLGLLRGITVVERLNVTALVDELALSGSGLVDPATAARSGRLLRASDVVQGTLGGDRETVRIDAAVVGTSGAVRASTAVSDPLERLFDIEAQVVFALADRLGITIDPATRERIAERPTQNVLAFLAYSRGLAARDAGDFGTARGAFDDAVRLDPSFAAARAGAQSARSLSRAAGAQPGALTGRLAPAAQRARLRETLVRIAPSRADFLRDRVRRAALERKALQEGTRTEGPADAAASTTIIVNIKRPGGSR